MGLKGFFYVFPQTYKCAHLSPFLQEKAITVARLYAAHSADASYESVHDSPGFKVWHPNVVAKCTSSTAPTSLILALLNKQRGQATHLKSHSQSLASWDSNCDS